MVLFSWFHSFLCWFLYIQQKGRGVFKNPIVERLAAIFGASPWTCTAASPTLVEEMDYSASRHCYDKSLENWPVPLEDTRRIISRTAGKYKDYLKKRPVGTERGFLWNFENYLDLL
jgi:hypothetical protein